MTYLLHLWDAALAALHAHPTLLHQLQVALHWLREHVTVEDATSLVTKLRALDWLRTKWRDRQCHPDPVGVRVPQPGQLLTPPQAK